MPRGIPALITLILLASALGIGAWWLAGGGRTSAQTTPAIVTSRPVPAAKWPPLRVMTANVRLDQASDGDNAWLKRRELLVKTLLKYQPEILGTQELSPAQGAYLTKEHSQWYSYYPRAGIPSATRPGAAEGQTRSAAAEFFGALGETLASLDTIYYRTDRFDLLAGEAGLVLPNQPQANASENTFFSMAVLQEKRAKKEDAAILLVIDIHFRHDEPFAIRCAQEMRRKITAWQTKYPNSGLLLMGDINRGRGTQLYAALTANEPAANGKPSTPAPFADSFDYSKLDPKVLNGTYMQFAGKPNATWPTDLIFAGGALSPAKPAEILRDHTPEGRYPSDHYFVQAEFDWK